MVASARCAGIWCHPYHAHSGLCRHLLLAGLLLPMHGQGDEAESAASACCIRQLLMGLWVVWPAGLNSAGSVPADWRTDHGRCRARRWGGLQS